MFFSSSHFGATLCRWRHSNAHDLPAAVRWRKQQRGELGPKAPVKSPEAVPGLRRKLAMTKHAPQLVDIMRKEQAAEFADFAKALQRSGELRDYSSFCEIIELQRERAVPVDGAQYGIMFTALARTSWGADGRGSDVIDRTRSLIYGKSIWQQIIKTGIVLTDPEYGGALSLCAKAGDAEWASQIWSEMLSQGLVPGSGARFHYLDALAKHGGEPGWAMVQSELKAMKHSGASVPAVLLSTLLNAAGAQYDLARVEQLWQDLLPVSVNLNVVPFGARCKALVICGVPDRATLLLSEMSAHNVKPDFRLYKNLVQAHLLLLHAEPTSSQRALDVNNVVASAKQQQHRGQPVSKNEMEELDTMHQHSMKIRSGDQVPLSQLQVERWPWSSK